MKKLVLATLLASASFAPAFAATDASAPAAAKPATTTTAPIQAAVKLDTDEAKLGYAMGLNMGTNLRIHQINIDTNAFIAGLQGALNNQPSLMTPAQIQEIMTKFQKEMLAKQEAAFKAESEKNLKTGKEFMDKYKKEKDVKTITDGSDVIAYKVVTAGKGPKPSLNDTVNISYTGTLVNGVVFDTTDKNKNKAVSLPLQQVIPGMQKVLTEMPTGSTWEVVIPPSLAYGDRGVGFGPIGPNETLIFKLTVNSIEKPAAAK